MKYLDLLRAWLVDPTPPTPPTLRAPVKEKRGVYVRRWARLCAQMTWTFAVGGAAVALYFAWRNGLLEADLAGLWIPLGLAAGFAAVAGAISSLPIAIIRMLRDPYRRELIRFRREKARQFATEQANYRSARKEFESSLRSRPANAEALLAEPYSDEAVRAASAAVRAWLDKAVAQENTARVLAQLGPDFSIWHDLEVGAANARIDHLLVGPQGLILIESLTATEPVSVEFDALVQGGRPTSDVIDSLRPRMVAVGRTLGIVRVSATVIVYPDAVLVDAGLQRLGGTPVPTFVVGASRLAEVLVQGLPRVDEGASWQLKNLRESVAQRVRFAQ